MSFNLIRNARVFFTTNVNAVTGAINSTGCTPSNTFEIQVLDGMSFSQNTSSETVTLTEAGATPVRGQRAFNSALDPVDFSFSTYMRPRDGGSNITAEESVLWNAMFAVDAIGGSQPAWADGVSNTTCVVTYSQKHQLQKFGLVILLDGSSYAIDNCVLDTATVDFGLDAIATIAWTGKGTILRQISGLAATTGGTVTFSGAGNSEVQTITVDASGGTFTITYSGQTTSALAFNITANDMQTALVALSNVAPGDVTVTGGVGASGGGTPYTLTWNAALGNVAAPTTNVGSLTGGAGTAAVVTVTPGVTAVLTGTAQGKNTTAPFIANKLSTLEVTSGIDGVGTAYTIALTGGSLTISNNVSYLTPANLGVVNLPATYFTGTRSITGSLTAYLRTGALNSAGLLADMLASSTSEVDPEFLVLVAVGGAANSVKVEFEMPACVLTIPAISTDQVVSVNINFTAQGSTASAFDIGAANELEIRYYHPNT